MAFHLGRDQFDCTFGPNMKALGSTALFLHDEKIDGFVLRIDLARNAPAGSISC